MKVRKKVNNNRRKFEKRSEKILKHTYKTKEDSLSTGGRRVFIED